MVCHILDGVYMRREVMLKQYYRRSGFSTSSSSFFGDLRKPTNQPALILHRPALFSKTDYTVLLPSLPPFILNRLHTLIFPPSPFSLSPYPNSPQSLNQLPHIINHKWRYSITYTQISQPPLQTPKSLPSLHETPLSQKIETRKSNSHKYNITAPAATCFSVVVDSSSAACG